MHLRTSRPGEPKHLVRSTTASWLNPVIERWGRLLHQHSPWNPCADLDVYTIAHRYRVTFDARVGLPDRSKEFTHLQKALKRIKITPQYAFAHTKTDSVDSDSMIEEFSSRRTRSRRDNRALVLPRSQPRRHRHGS